MVPYTLTILWDGRLGINLGLSYNLLHVGKWQKQVRHAMPGTPRGQRARTAATCTCCTVALVYFCFVGEVAAPTTYHKHFKRCNGATGE